MEEKLQRIVNDYRNQGIMISNEDAEHIVTVSDAVEEIKNALNS